MISKNGEEKKEDKEIQDPSYFVEVAGLVLRLDGESHVLHEVLAASLLLPLLQSMVLLPLHLKYQEFQEIQEFQEESWKHFQHYSKPYP